MDDVHYQIGKLNLRDGDTLIVQVNVTKSPSELKEIRDIFFNLLSNDRINIIVLDNTIELSKTKGKSNGKT